MYNFHVFVGVSTIIYYIVLRSFRGSLNANKPRRKKKESKLAYVMYLPLVLYLCYYLFINNPPKTKIQRRTLSSSVDTSPFPASNSFSISI